MTGLLLDWPPLPGYPIRNFRFFVHVFPSRFFMPRKGAEVAESVEPLIFTTFRFIPCMKRCRGFMEEGWQVLGPLVEAYA
jgi:hypothetical protein